MGSENVLRTCMAFNRISYTDALPPPGTALMKLLARNLDRSLSEASLSALFEAFGRVQSCSLVMDAKTGVSKGFGFIEMPVPGEAKAAVKQLNGSTVSGQVIRVKKAQ